MQRFIKQEHRCVKSFYCFILERFSTTVAYLSIVVNFSYLLFPTPVLDCFLVLETAPKIWTSPSAHTVVNTLINMT